MNTRQKASLRAFRNEFPNAVSDSESEGENEPDRLESILETRANDSDDEIYENDESAADVPLTFTNCTREHVDRRHITTRNLKKLPKPNSILEADLEDPYELYNCIYTDFL